MLASSLETGGAPECYQHPDAPKPADSVYLPTDLPVIFAHLAVLAGLPAPCARGGPTVTSLRERLGIALQRQRQVHGLSQAQLGKLAKISLKYIGEIERGEANASLEALERLTNALEWDPFELPLREQDTLPEGVRTLLLANLTHMQHMVQTSIGWVQTLDAAMARRAAQPEPPPMEAAPWPEERHPARPRGRPRKSKVPSPDPDES
jgi:transcriptional regulator with XRE-family HTH domain